MTLFPIIAWYGVALVAGQWVLIGPYAERGDCTSVVEWLDTQGFETESCTMLSTGAEGILIAVGEMPR